MPGFPKRVGKEKPPPGTPRKKSPKPPAVRIGRPSEYKPEYDDLVERLCLLGMDNEELATFFGTSASGIQNWANKHPSFMVARARGREIADANVATSLYKRANGYEHPAEKIHFDKFGQVHRADYVEKYAPDTNAASIWLYNRQPTKWRQKTATDAQGEGAIPIKIVGGLPED